MHPEKFHMKWNAYSDHLRYMMKEIMNDDFTDVTLVTEDREHIRAHKNILSACSPVFKDIVKLEQSEEEPYPSMKAGFFLFLQLKEETEISVMSPCDVLQPDTKVSFIIS